MNYKIWNKTDNLITPTMEVFTPQQVFAKYPAAAVDGFKFIICDSPISMGVFMEYTQTKETYKNMGAEITEDMSDEEVLQAITDFENRPQEQPISDTERIASALEFQNILALENTEVQ